MKSAPSLRWALERLSVLQGAKLDPLRLGSALDSLSDTLTFAEFVAVCNTLELQRPLMLEVPDRAHLPLLCCLEGGKWGVLVDQDSAGQWVVEFIDGVRQLDTSALQGSLVWIRRASADKKTGSNSFRDALKRALRGYRGAIFEATFASFFIGLISLATSLFSMQVYDRVIPTRSEQTLIILGVGVLLSMAFELAMKIARSSVMETVIVGLDSQLSRDIFQRLLDLRVDQLPGSVGSLAGQIRGYEQVRSFYTATTLFTLVDLPIGIIFLVIMAMIGSPVLVAAPLVFGLVALTSAYVIRRKMQRLAHQGAAASNLKTGLLVEAVEGAETIKAGSGGWKFLARWIGVTAQTIENDIQMRSANDSLGYKAATMQQLSYAGIVVLGSWEVMNGTITMGALIACSILSGRIMAPILTMPSLLVQHSHAKAAMRSLEKLYELESDHHNQHRPLLPSTLEGNFLLQDVRFIYPNSPSGVLIKHLHIRPGEKVAVVGPIGAGKSTLLRMMAGLYRPQRGRVLIDGLDMAQISRQVLSQQIGYLQQEHRLFEGTLRENLLIGLPDPGDDVLKKVLVRSGLMRLVSTHPRGLDLHIQEGGKGLSGGQRQLVAFTRLFLCHPNIWLLDEPTANMDEEQERNCVALLKEELAAGKTFVLVTHKSSLLPLVDRVVVVVDQQIIMDGPRDAVLAQLRTPHPATAVLAKPPVPAVEPGNPDEQEDTLKKDSLP